MLLRMVVYRPFPTSNHNSFVACAYVGTLYIVRFLHQTTTPSKTGVKLNKLYIVRFLHQTTTYMRATHINDGCISSVSYIKPQLWDGAKGSFSGCISSVSYIKPQLISFIGKLIYSCISSVSYIKPQPVGVENAPENGCISSVSYIKPQLVCCVCVCRHVVYRPFPTSNHNSEQDRC